MRAHGVSKSLTHSDLSTTTTSSPLGPLSLLLGPDAEQAVDGIQAERQRLPSCRRLESEEWGWPHETPATRKWRKRAPRAPSYAPSADRRPSVSCRRLNSPSAYGPELPADHPSA